VSYVSVGDGSVNNAHFLTALNLAKYAQHRSFKCPIILSISDNNKCISLEGFKWIQKFVANSGVKYFIADGTDISSVYTQSKAAVDYARCKYIHTNLCVYMVLYTYIHTYIER
jgi:TPP-dependent pyruvate/acetoin dehydrogenase alpha subunit